MSTEQMLRRIEEAAEMLRSSLQGEPEIGLILGSGLGVLADLIEQPQILKYSDIPNFPVSTVEGHAGEFVFGTIQGKRVLMMKGRFHMYEGYDVETVTFPIRVMRMLGVSKLVVTNAAGGINTDYASGELMLIRDHINMTFRNPLIGPNLEQFGARFPDMSEAYSARMREVAKQTAAELGVRLQEGVYVGLLGPSYETPAEIRMMRTLGADAVGMSTVPEVIAARHAGIEVLGISCISNMASGILQQPLSHAEVMETTERVKDKFLKLVMAVIPKL